MLLIAPIALWLTLGLADRPAGLDLHVSTAGKDTWSGQRSDPAPDGSDGPFASLERARDEIRSRRAAGNLPAGSVVVHVQKGAYWRDRTLELTRADSGTPASPVLFRAEPFGGVRLLGGREVGGFKAVADPAVLERLEPAARGKVLTADLKAAGVVDFGRLTTRGFGRPVTPAGLELFYQDRPMRLARWPNEGWLKTVDVPAGPEGGRFTYEGDRPRRWARADDIWVHGYWTWDWAESYEKVRAIDPEKREIATEPPHGVYGYKPGKRFYVLNLLEELDAPGEWYLDRKGGRVYFWPPDEPADPAGVRVLVSLLERMITMNDVSFVTFQGFGIEALRGTAVQISGGAHNALIDCTLRNIGNLAVTIENATHTGVSGCDISETGDGGISITGGDRRTLAPGHLYALNNHIWRFSRWDKTYRPAISVNGVGNRVANNLLHDAPHMAIGLSGNEHIIELNEIHTVCMETDDVGAFYMGRDWTQRGNIVRHNYFHDLGGHGGVGTMAVYLDDWTSGTTVFGNVCCKAGRAVLVGGGRDNTVDNNIFVDCAPSVHVDSRGLGWAKYYFDGKDNTLVDRLNAMNYRQPPYSTRYPELLTLYDDEPAVAKGNKVLRNISVGGRWLDLLDGLTDKVVTVKDNLVDQDPHFVSREGRDFRLRDDSPAFKLGFRPIPIEKIGLQRSLGQAR